MRGTKQQELWALKVKWMVAHRDLWAHVQHLRLPSSGRPLIYIHDRSTWRAIANGLKDAGYISRKTGTIDVPVLKLIAAAQQVVLATVNEENQEAVSSFP